MGLYSIIFYSEAVLKEIDHLPTGFKVRFTVLAERMKTYGPNLGEPHTKIMGKGLIEMRLKSQEGIARVLYYTLVGTRIVILHSFIKKHKRHQRSI